MPLGSLTRRTRRRGMLLAGLVGLGAFTMSLASHSRVKPPVGVVVTRRALAAGTVLTSADLALESLPAPGLPDRVATLTAAVGHTLAFGLAAHQPLVPGDLVHAPEVDGLKANEVAVMLPVSLASSDDVQPNDRVNVIWLGGTSSMANATAPGTVLATGLRVLAVLNQNGSPVTPEAAANGLNASTPAVVEVAVPQGEAGTLAVAASSGRFWLALNPWAGPQDSLSGGTAASAPISPIGSSSADLGRLTSSRPLPGSAVARGGSLKPLETPSSAVSPRKALPHGIHAAKTRVTAPAKIASSPPSSRHHG